LEKGQIDLAIDNFNVAILLDPTSSVSFNDRGNAFFNKKDYSLASADFDRATQLAPDDPHPYVGRGNVLQARRNYPDAIAEYTRAIQLDTKSIPPFYNRGSAFLAMSDYDHATADYLTVIHLDPKYVAAYASLASLYQQKGKGDLAIAYHDRAIQLLLPPGLTIDFPENVEYRPGSMRGFQFASPPLPDEDRLRQCRSQANSDDDFMLCVIDQALPKEYRVTRQCLKENPSEGARALVCSIGDSNISAAYDGFSKVSSCANRQGNDLSRVAECVEQAALGPDGNYYLECIKRNSGSPASGAVCALGKNLTPEQQIAVSCAAETGMEPHAFVLCTGGQLFQSELDKCWKHGIATDEGCFGPNNEYRRFLGRIDDQMKHAFGENSVAYQTYKLLQDNVLAPGPNHEVIKFVNNSINDIQNGPGPNNEFVKAANGVAGVAKSVGKLIGL
jgi:hypothetical protein